MSPPAINRIIVSNRLRHVKKLVRSLSVTASSYNVRIRDGIMHHPEFLDIPKVSIPQFVFERLEEFPHLISHECGITGRKYTFGEVRSRSRNLSKALRKKFGLQKGDVALVYLPNIPEFAIVILGCLEAGVISSTVNCLYTPDEIARQLKDSSAKIIITCHEVYDNAVKATQKLSKKVPIICIKTSKDQLLPRDSIDFEEVSTTPIDIPDLELPGPEDIAILPYSSGTTGLPKGVMLSHSNIVSNLAQIDVPEIKFVQKASGNYQEIVPGILPMFHIYGFTITTLFMMINGAKLVTLPRFHPDTFINVLKNYKISVIFAAPPLILFLTHHPGVKKEYLKSLHTVMSGAAPLGALDETKFLQKVDNNVFLFQGYGLTETSPVLSMVTKTLKKQYGEATSGSIGKLIPNTEGKIVKMDDPTGTPVGPNESGELLVRGPQVMKGYHKNPESTANTFLDGWLRTGDLAYYDEQGLIFITDRVKELIKVKGFQVAPAELEELLRHHPNVADAAVIGIPHEVHGEIPRAYIQPKGEIDIDDLNKFVNEKVAKYKRLGGGIQIVKEIPKNPAGKILRRTLKEQYLRERKERNI